MRLVGAFLVTLFAFGIFGGALGFASAAEEAAEPEEKRTLWPDDEGAYQVVFDLPYFGERIAFNNIFETRFKALPADQFVDAYGSVHQVIPLRMQFVIPDFFAGNPFSNGPTVVEDQWLISGKGAIAHGGEGEVAYDNALGSESFRTRSYKLQPVTPCFFMEEHTRTCNLPQPFSGTVANMTWQNQGHRYEIIGDMNGQFIRLHIDHEDEIPVPTKFSILHSNVNEELTVSWELTGFASGTPIVPQLPSPPTLGRSYGIAPWGLDETGANMQHPASEAFLAAQSDLLYTDLRDFLQANPGAKTVHAVPSFQQLDGRSNHQWEFGLLADRASFRFTATETETDLLGLSSFAFETLNPIPLQPLPDSLPTAASLIEVALAMKTFPSNNEEPAWKIQDGAVFGGYWNPEHRENLPSNSIQQVVWYEETARGSPQQVVETSTESKSVAPLFTGEAPSSLPEKQTAQTWHPPTAEAAAGIGFVSLLFGALYYFWPALKQGAFVGLFSRVKQDEVLLHPARSQIMEAVRGNPGIHRNALERHTGLKSGTLRHHLDILTTKGKIIAKKQGGFSCYAVPEHYQHMAGAGAVKSDGAQNILDVIRENPGTNARQVAGTLQLSPGTVAYHLKRLREAGVIQSVREGRQTFLYLTDGPVPAA